MGVSLYDQCLLYGVVFAVLYIMCAYWCNHGSALSSIFWLFVRMVRKVLFVYDCQLLIYIHICPFISRTFGGNLLV